MNFKVDDFVRYVGDQHISDGPLRDPAEGIITHISTPINEERVNLKLIKIQKGIQCGWDKIRPIEVHEQHFLASGFNKVNAEVSFCFVRGSLIISRQYFSIPKIKFQMSTGWCLGNLTNLSDTDMAKYVVNLEFDIDNFFNDYPPVQEINALFSILDQADVSYNKNEIASL